MNTSKLLSLILLCLLLAACGNDNTNTIHSKSWGTPKIIESNPRDAEVPQVDTGGSAIAVWRQHDGSSYSIYASYYSSGSGWGTPELIETASGWANDPQIAFDSNGNAIAVWEQADGQYTNVYANYYTAGSGWGTAEIIDAGNLIPALTPQIAFDSNGNAIAVWEQNYSTYANYYISGSGWSGAVLIESNSGLARIPQIAFDLNGNAIAVWKQRDASYFSIYANYYTAGSGWGTAELIETGNSGSADNPQIVFDSNGNAIAVWEQIDGVYSSIYANHFISGSGWDNPLLIESGQDQAYDPQIAFDSNGNAIAVWEQYDKGYKIYANRYISGSGWDNPLLIESGVGSSSDPQIAFDLNGNAIAVWVQTYNQPSSIYANYYTTGTGWGTAELIETDNSGTAHDPQIAIDSNGNAVVVWRQDDGSYDSIYANWYE